MYLDSSLLVRLYIEERGSDEMDDQIRSLDQPPPLTFLHEIEIVNALYRAVFHRRLSNDAAATISHWLNDDVDAGLFRRVAVDLAALVRHASDIGRRCVTVTGARSLDVMHVAMAELLGADLFATADDRQRALAWERGLQLA